MATTKKSRAGYLGSTYQVKEALKTPDTKLKLEFDGFQNVKDATLEVKYRGSQIRNFDRDHYTEKAIDDLQFTCNRQVTFVGLDSGGWNFDSYIFKIHLNKIVDKNKRKPKGKLFRVEDVYEAFVKGCGKEWALMYILYREYTNGDIAEPEKLGIEVKDDAMYIDNKRIYDIWEYKKEVNHTFDGVGTSKLRTSFNATFDLLIPERDLVKLILEKIRQATSAYFERNGLEHVTCDAAYIQEDYTRGDAIIMQLANPYLQNYDHYDESFRVNNQRLDKMNKLVCEYRSAWFFLNKYTLNKMVVRNSPNYSLVNLTTVGDGYTSQSTEEYAEKPTINYILKNTRRLEDAKKITLVKVNNKRFPKEKWNEKLDKEDIVYITFKTKKDA